MKFDMTALTLHQIKKSVKQIDRKVSKLLRAPLLNAIDHFNEVTDYFLSKKFEKAYITVDKVLNNATDAFNKIADENIDMETFADCVKAVQLLIFSKIISESYDSKQKIFLPYAKLSKDTKEVISRFIVRNVDKCISLKGNVEVSMFSFDKAKKKSIIQDMLDSILQLAYPYISQGNGWTDLNSKILNLVANCKVKFEVNPKYLPMGEEDKTQVIIGKTVSEIIRCYMWREEDFVFTEHGNEKVKVQCAIDKLSSVCCTIPYEKHLVLSSANTLIWKRHAVVGQYEYGGEHNGYPYYKQKGESFHLYYGTDNQWHGSKTLSDTGDIILYNPHPDPRDGWKFRWGNDSATLTLTPGHLTPCRLRVTLAGKVADKFAKCQGEYTVENGRWDSGRPMYTNSSGSQIRFCYRFWLTQPSSGSDAWIRPDTDEDVICPASVKKWKWTLNWREKNWKHANVSITCSVH